ncbi:MAG TPA: addiction module protein [Verrucomicrobia bacterium]|nr:addiction module protein [Verrucomicrobiota bacterium]
MTAKGQAVLNEALMLPPVERASLIEELLSSFDAPARKIIDATWAQEAEERIDAYEQGKLQALSLEQVIGRINAK